MAHKHHRRSHVRQDTGDERLNTCDKKLEHGDDAEFGTEPTEESSFDMTWSHPVLDPSGRFFYQAMRLSDGSLKYHIEGLQASADPIEASQRYRNHLSLQGLDDRNQLENLQHSISVEQQQLGINHSPPEAASNSSKVAIENCAGNANSHDTPKVASVSKSRSTVVFVEAGSIGKIQQVKQVPRDRKGRKAAAQEITVQQKRIKSQDRKYQERQAQKGARSRQIVYHWLYASEP
ncbi:hypothetical protein PFICI_11119 [Pestalotiopsis fici W106-1]|uniref:Uncharacterized protein n=1 Tax=Pestalotiopsis fici (strain W106-1 / CGMCC3.15140) TaxID=1229662 RepID=W3WTS3_PESFW|nr:uncharacterized protein PFICI_11119 [Pestalotiopsis fici W106-1]ETS77245.1 hypothetical protein PFICI_11119 [Pestalotiopsis fici W106-1]